MTASSYKQFCPVAMAAEILCSRWTMVLIRELIAGSTRFNELRRGVPRMSPALLSTRLKDLERDGILSRSRVKGEPDIFEYRLTAAGRDLEAVIEAAGVWGQQWITTSSSLQNVDPGLLMWDIRRNIDPSPMPSRRSTIQVIFSDLRPPRRDWWLVVDPDEGVDLCSVEPGFEVDLYLSTDLQSLTAIWMGYLDLSRARDDGRLLVTGDKRLGDDLGRWLTLSRFAKVPKLVA